VKRATKGSGNVFRDLALPDADILQAKADLVHEIAVILEQRRLNQVEAAQVLGITQPKVSALLNGHLEGFSLERIARFLNALGRDLKISVRPKSGSRPAIHVG
jgi:predicted XRE-type DNA-binding protein